MGDVNEKFLSGGGEMGTLTRDFDWSSTPVGPVTAWPQSLKTSLSIVLNSKFPMLLFWGKEMTSFYNDAFRPSLGNQGKHPSSLGKSAREVWAELWHVIGPMLENVISRNEAVYFENLLVPFFRNDRMEDTYFTFSYSPVADESGMPCGILVSCIETTENLSTLKQLKQSEGNLRSLILQSPVAMCIFKGPDQILEIGNERMFELWGRPGVELLNKPIFAALPEAANQGFEELLSNVYRTGKSFSANGVPITLPRSTRVETIYVNFLYEPFRDNDGTISGVMAVASDVTPQVLAQQKIEEAVANRTKELKEANRELNESNKELGQFAYIASHDLQEPARKIRTFAGMLQEIIADDPERSATLLAKISRASERMLTLIRSVLKYSQLAKEDQKFDRVDLNDVVSNIEDDFELLIAESNTVISFDELPVVTGIPVQIAQLFSNLLSNSLKFRKSDMPLVVKISGGSMSTEEIKENPALNADMCYAKILFSDNGIGFNQTQAIRIFDIFFRLHDRSKFEGTGIGLAMAKKIVQNHYGDIYASSTEGSGAVFEILLPEYTGAVPS